ncbi:response regulator [Oxalobacter formigenes]
MELNWLLNEYDGIVYVSDMQTYELLHMNRAGCEAFGVNEESFRDHERKCYEVLQSRDSPCPFCTNHHLKDSGFYEWEHYNDALNTTYLLKDRKFMWNGREARIEFATDISGYSKKIAIQEKERNSILKSLPGGIARLDARDMKTVLWYGANFLRMIGYTPEQFREELNSESRYIHPDDCQKVAALMASLKISGETAMDEMRIVRRDGDVRTLNITLSYEDGESSEDGIPSYYSVGVDITEVKARQALQQKALEEACQAARMANNAKANFLSSMSHDIRTPMNAILGMTAIADMHAENPARVRDCLKKITTSSKYLLSLINEILDMSRIENGKLAICENNFDLGELVENTLELCRPLLMQKNHEIRIAIGRNIHESLVGDADRLQKVFLNILSNAIKYTPDGGLIEWTVNERPLELMDFAMLEFVFRDNGIGMSEEFVEHIYEPFVRAEDTRINDVQGTGLGMAIAGNIVHMMNGTITVDSVLGEGSCFRVNVPLKIQEQSVKLSDEFSGLSVLLVDDDRDVCENTSSVLKELGVDVQWVLNGYDAVDAIRIAHEKNADFFAAIIDWKMPEMNGLETVRAIREQVDPDMPLIIMSAYDYSDIGEALKKAAADAFMTKPLFCSKLVRMLRQFLEKGNAKTSGGDAGNFSGDLEGRRILLVEDNALNRDIARELLELKGAIVDVAQNGRQAVEFFSASPQGWYDLILMDIQMPVMNGYEACAAIRAMGRKDAKEIPVLALTANAFVDDVIKAKKAGMDGHLAKPVDADKMITIIRKWLSSPENMLTK